MPCALFSNKPLAFKWLLTVIVAEFSTPPAPKLASAPILILPVLVNLLASVVKLLLAIIIAELSAIPLKSIFPDVIINCAVPALVKLVLGSVVKSFVT